MSKKNKNSRGEPNDSNENDKSSLEGSGESTSAAEAKPGKADAKGDAKTDAKTDPKADKSKPVHPPGTWRETIESVVIAFVLAFLFRGFEAEAFVIPTGSMAPTLTGLHKDLSGSFGCAQCGQSFFVGATDEVNNYTNEQEYDSLPNSSQPDFSRPWRVGSATCPSCAYPMQIGPDNPQGKEYLSYSGDRILVSKFAYQWTDPDRWDVVVFKYPIKSQRNYIKRLIGRPNETIRIFQGDVYVRNDLDKEADFVIARKEPNKLRAMLQLVYDNDRSLPAIVKAGWEPRWSPLADAALVDQPPAQATWQEQDEGKSFQTDGAGGWLRYRHLPPMVDEWRQLEQAVKDGTQAAVRPQPVLIADFTAYNSGNFRYSYHTKLPTDYMSALGHNWVGDLTLDCQLETGAPAADAMARIELVRSARLECRFDLTSGVATLLKDGVELAVSKGPTPVRGAGKWDLAFANVDQQLTVWVNGTVQEFVPVLQTPDSPAMVKQVNYQHSPAIPTPADLAPAGIAVQGAAATVRHLKLWRDIYYIAAKIGDTAALDLRGVGETSIGENSLLNFLRNPARWDAYRDQREVQFPLRGDEFFVLGDNSARSQDSRLWSEFNPREPQYIHAVKRDLLIGKALFIYWPHAWETPINFEITVRRFGRIRVPFYPNFQRMQLIR